VQNDPVNFVDPTGLFESPSGGQYILDPATGAWVWVGSPTGSVTISAPRDVDRFNGAIFAALTGTLRRPSPTSEDELKYQVGRGDTEPQNPTPTPTPTPTCGVNPATGTPGSLVIPWDSPDICVLQSEEMDGLEHADRSKDHQHMPALTLLAFLMRHGGDWSRLGVIDAYSPKRSQNPVSAVR